MDERQIIKEIARNFKNGKRKEAVSLHLEYSKNSDISFRDYISHLTAIEIYLLADLAIEELIN